MVPSSVWLRIMSFLGTSSLLNLEQTHSLFRKTLGSHAFAWAFCLVDYEKVQDWASKGCEESCFVQKYVDYAWASRHALYLPVLLSPCPIRMYSYWLCCTGTPGSRTKMYMEDDEYRRQIDIDEAQVHVTFGCRRPCDSENAWIVPALVLTHEAMTPRMVREMYTVLTENVTKVRSLCDQRHRLLKNCIRRIFSPSCDVSINKQEKYRYQNAWMNMADIVTVDVATMASRDAVQISAQMDRPIALVKTMLLVLQQSLPDLDAICAYSGLVPFDVRSMFLQLDYIVHVNRIIRRTIR